MPRVVCAGHVNWDVTLRVDSIPELDGEATVESRSTAGGGSASNVAVGLSDLGLDVSLLGSVGDDEHGRAARAELVAEGVDCDHVVTTDELETTTKYIVVQPTGEVMVLGCPGANEAFDAADLPESVLQDADHLHLTSQRPETAKQLADRAASVGVPVSFDPGRRIGDRGYEVMISDVDYLFLNDREAALALDAFDLDGQTLVLKHGPDGAEVRRPDGRVAHPGYPIDAVDTTGAGDAFAAGFIASRVAGDDFERALAVANACGAFISRVPGAREGLSWNEIEAFLGE
ncbi:carbohydrate kinase family protein [Halogeometricum borinquense]|uniref:Sugar kinase n=2 Tax=Halogeometricum borinquense TaxID=60847 RepID=E4NPS8_HALBP|nr:carbohydrate kinase family protein [Halogeometricum borinquense]ADQ66561.1 sugar kinase, ribokinase [Halogeometricum borinquense DSM 11551]ELY30669.1 sugar kinase [Halogeometricum borinquense DSM 11551]QIB75115.1 carbohydrate kinase family protein [Halogeometricum borinquense]QIQ75903.1 carbohydrate kinase family protein [Halogeometricum borinquense]RYJ14421.1 carbohydrate kinase family protein [Halogeometricum borinquense]